MKPIAIAAVALAAAGSANAAIYQYEWTPGAPGSYGINHNGGQIDRILGTFDTDSKELSWVVTFGNQVTEGITLAVSPGPNPKNNPGELALFYLDAKDINDPRLTAYGYNGQNNASSWQDGDSATGGNQTPDNIMTDANTSIILDKMSIDNADGTRTLGFTIDASDIISHVPVYPSATDPWTGAQWGEKIGVWMHTFRTFNVGYDNDGLINSFNKGGEGWFDGHNLDTTLIPTPGALALAGLGALATIRRKR